MPKRGRDTLTGGTHDVNPQFMNIVVTNTTGVNTGAVTTYVLPKSPITQNGRAQIIEILKIFWENGPMLHTDAQFSQSLAVCTANPGTAAAVLLSDPKCLALLRTESVSTTASQWTENDRIKVTDLTDGAGHGVLVATDNLFVQNWQGNQALTMGSAVDPPLYPSVKILYRYKNVSVQEYIGIVQGQN